jgi:biotin transporter BioY
MEFFIYLLGVAIFSAFYDQIKAALGGWAPFMLFVVAYLAVVRLIGYRVHRHVLRKRKQRTGPER